MGVLPVLFGKKGEFEKLWRVRKGFRVYDSLTQGADAFCYTHSKKDCRCYSGINCVDEVDADADA